MPPLCLTPIMPIMDKPRRDLMEKNDGGYF